MSHIFDDIKEEIYLNPNDIANEYLQETKKHDVKQLTKQLEHEQVKSEFLQHGIEELIMHLRELRYKYTKEFDRIIETLVTNLHQANIQPNQHLSIVDKAKLFDSLVANSVSSTSFSSDSPKFPATLVLDAAVISMNAVSTGNCKMYEGDITSAVQDSITHAIRIAAGLIS